MEEETKNRFILLLVSARNGLSNDYEEDTLNPSTSVWQT